VSESGRCRASSARRALCKIALLALLPVFSFPAFSQEQGGAARAEIQARPIPHFHPADPDRRRFGALEFRGGLELTSPHKDFGGLSGFVMDADGENFIAITDKSVWVRGRIRYDGGVPAGIDEAEIAPMLGPDGRTLAARRWYDTESLTRAGTTVYVGIERVHQIVRFDYGKDGLRARGQPIAVPAEIGKLPSNKGIECLAAVPAAMPHQGALIAISERGLDADKNIRGFLIGGAAAGGFSVRRSDDFDITDCAVTPDAELVILERRFSWLRGVAMRMRRVPLSAIAPGALVDGPTLIEADFGYQIDNMEGLGVHRAPDGQIVLTIVSDDNFSPLQRTILLQFTLLDR
jgi:hypothetical protein